MRDLARIHPTLAVIELLWKRNPDMRLGQLLLNLEHDDLWNIEDEDLMNKAADVIAKGWVGNKLCHGHTEVTA